MNLAMKNDNFIIIFFFQIFSQITYKYLLNYRLMQTNHKTKTIQKIKKCGKRMMPLMENNDVAKLYRLKLDKAITKIKQIIQTKQTVLDSTINFLNSSLQRIPKNQNYYDEKRKVIGKFEKQLVLIERHVQQIDNILMRLRDSLEIQNTKIVEQPNQVQSKQSYLIFDENQMQVEDQQYYNTQKFEPKQYNLILRGLQVLNTTQLDLKLFVIAKIYHNNKKWYESINSLDQIKQSNELNVVRLYGLNYMRIAKGSTQALQFYANNAIKYLQKCIEKPWKKIKGCFSLLGEAYYLKSDIKNMEKFYLKELQFRDMQLDRADNKFEFDYQTFSNIAKNATTLQDSLMGNKYYKKAIESLALFNEQKRVSFLYERIKYFTLDPQITIDQLIKYYKQIILFIEKQNNNMDSIQLCKEYHRLALLLAQIQQYNEAIQYANIGFKHFNNIDQEYVNYATYHYRLKKYEEAKKILMDGIKNNPENKLAYQLLAKIKYDTLSEFDCVIYLKQLNENLYTKWQLNLLISFHQNEGDSEEVNRLGELLKVATI